MQLLVHGKAPANRKLLPAKLLFIMRLTAFLILLGSLHVSASGYSQEITISSRNIPLEKVFKLVEQQTGYSFLWNEQLLVGSPSVNIDVKKASLTQVLDQCLTGTGLAYRIKDKLVLIEAAPTIHAEPIPAELLPGDVIGRVINEKGEPLEGINVMVKGANKWAITNANGEFTLKKTDPNAYVVFSGANVETYETRLNGRTSISVTLKTKVSALDEVQIIAYGSTTRRKATGSISSVTSEDISRQNITNPLAALQGRIPGAVITQDNGLMGGGVRVSIRDAGSGVSMAGYIPLYVVDGVPFTLFNGGFPATDNLNAYGISGANGGISPLSMINPDDIERIDVLKDADATAIYGSRGANGVILITTKKGGTSKTIFNINANHGISQVNHFIPMMNTPQYLEMRKEAFSNAGITPTTSNALDLTVWSQTANTDWQKWAIGRTAHNTNATASVSGGNAQTKFLYSSTWRNEGTVYPGSYNNSMFSNRLNASHTTKDGKFNIALSTSYSYMKNNLPSVDISSIYNLPPNFPIYNADGSLNFTVASPLSYLMRQYNAATTNLIGNLTMSYELLTGLRLKANLGYSKTTLGQTSTNPAAAQNAASSTISKLDYAQNDNDNYTVEPQVEYSRFIARGKFNALAGATFQQNKSTGISMSGTGFSNDDLITSIAAASTILINYNNYSLYKYNALFGKINYSWDNKYILDATGRRDGSSRFGSGRRFGNFGAIGAAWIFSEETFFRHQHLFSFGKLRGSYGITGNDQIPNYQYYALYSPTSAYNYGGNSILYPSNISNPDLHWEKTTQLDLALELGLLKDRILFKADFYRKRTSDVLLFVTTPTQSGTNSYMGNLPAVLQNQGLELEVNTTNVNEGDFKWTTYLNLTIPSTKLVSFPNLANSSYSSSYIIGKPVNLQKFYRFQDIDPGNGLPLFQDQNGDGQMTYAADRIPAGIGHPFYGGIGNNFTYKGFSLNFVFQFNHRMGYVNSTIGTYPNTNPLGYTYSNQSTAALDRWKTFGDKALFPKATVSSNAAITNYIYYSSSAWGDASFARLKTVSLQYTLPQNLTKKINFSNITVYAQGQNMFTWAKQKYTYDPETAIPGADPGIGNGRYMSFPPLRTIVIGLNCSF